MEDKLLISYVFSAIGLFMIIGFSFYMVYIGLTDRGKIPWSEANPFKNQNK